MWCWHLRSVRSAERIGAWVPGCRVWTPPIPPEVEKLLGREPGRAQHSLNASGRDSFEIPSPLFGDFRTKNPTMPKRAVESENRSLVCSRIRLGACFWRSFSALSSGCGPAFGFQTKWLKTNTAAITAISTILPNPLITAPQFAHVFFRGIGAHIQRQ